MSEKGFSIAECLLMLLGVSMVCAGCIALTLSDGKIAETPIKLAKISSKVEEFNAFQTPEVLPRTLGELIEPPGGEPPYLRKEDLRDEWGQPIVYKQDGLHYAIRSAGPDKAMLTDDDIVWTSDE